MAQLVTHGNWKSISAMASMLTFLGVLLYAILSGESLGIWPYLLAVVVMTLGFISKEDHIAVVGITGIFTVVILDVMLRIGLLAFNHCHDTFSMWTGC